MASFDDNDTKLSVDETKLDCPGASALPLVGKLGASGIHAVSNYLN